MELGRHGVRVWLPEADGPVDPGDPTDRALVTLLGAHAKREFVRARHRTSAAMRAQTVEQGRFLGGRPPYGHRLHGDCASGLWTAPTVGAILSTPRYTGRETWSRRQAADRRGRATAWGEAAVSKVVSHPGLVTESDFVAAQQIRAARAGGDGRTRQYVLRGLVRCTPRDIVEFLRANDMVVEVYDAASWAVTSNDLQTARGVPDAGIPR